MLIKLKQLRNKYGISQKQLASEVGVSQQSINKYENHNIEPDIDTLIRMADYFNTSVDYLIEHDTSLSEVDNYQICKLSSDEMQIMNKYRQLSFRQRQSIQLILDNYTEMIANSPATSTVNFCL